MRTSCNACRVLRKGCSDDCSLRPCLHWIKSSDSQANATIFLAKFYGRAGLINLINAAPHHLRPAIFWSLLYEACGRIINPVFGSVGLLCSSNWDCCQSAVDSVLNGSPLMQLPSDEAAAEEVAAAQPIMPLNGCDIRHLTKAPNDLNRVQTKTRFKRSGGRGRGKSQLVSLAELTSEPTGFSISGWVGFHPDVRTGGPIHDAPMFSVETVEASLSNRVQTDRVVKFECPAEESEEIGLELSLGFNPVVSLATYGGGAEMIDVSDGDAKDRDVHGDPKDNS